MGTREEGRGHVVVKGFSGKIRPAQSEGGRCKVCEEPVFVDMHDHSGASLVPTDRVTYVHHGCER